MGEGGGGLGRNDARHQINVFSKLAGGMAFCWSWAIIAVLGGASSTGLLPLCAPTHSTTPASRCFPSQPTRPVGLRDSHPLSPAGTVAVGITMCQEDVQPCVLPVMACRKCLYRARQPERSGKQMTLFRWTQSQRSNRFAHRSQAAIAALAETALVSSAKVCSRRKSGLATSSSSRP